MSRPRCSNPLCDYEGACFFYTNQLTKILCDECHEHDWGENSCVMCEKGCHAEGYVEYLGSFVCARCARKDRQEGRAIDRAIDATIDAYVEEREERR